MPDTVALAVVLGLLGTVAIVYTAGMFLFIRDLPKPPKPKRPDIAFAAFIIHTTLIVAAIVFVWQAVHGGSGATGGL